MSAPAGPLRIGLAGFGTVGRAVARILCDGRYPGLHLTGICTRRTAAARTSAPWVPARVAWTSDIEGLLETGADVVVEVIGGLEPARSWIDRALRAGRSVVTANKLVVAEYGPELVATARSCGRAIRFEAAVGGATPIVRGVQEGLGGDRLTRIVGVVNGTCNFVLTQMQRPGVSMAAAVSEAQARGLAEADPGADLDGLDARAKLSILATLGFEGYLPPRDIPAESIRAIDGGDVTAAASVGCVIRQVAWAGRKQGGAGAIHAGVGAALVPERSWLARADGAGNVIVVSGERSGTTVFAGEGAGGDATAVAVLSDLLALRAACSAPAAWPARAPSAPAPSDFTAAHYVRVSTGDTAAPGRAAAALADCGIAIDRVLDPSPGGCGRFTALVHPCSHAELTRALTALHPAAEAGKHAVGLPFIDAE